MTVFHFGEVLSSLRQSAGMTQKELAEMAGVFESTISGFERSECYPCASIIIKLSIIFDVSIEELCRIHQDLKETINLTDMPPREFEFFCTLLGFIRFKSLDDNTK